MPSTQTSADEILKMLYRNPDSPVCPSLLRRLRHGLLRLGRTRHRRLARIDLMSASPHLKRDLGLHEADLRVLVGRK
jgi:hypothetical protein